MYFEQMCFILQVWFKVVAHRLIITEEVHNSQFQKGL